MTKTIAVYGATGKTGRLISELLTSRGAKLVIGGRSFEKVEELARELSEGGRRVPGVRIADARVEAEVELFLEGVDVLVNCAGPFGEVGEVMLTSAMKLGVHYLDISGEQSHMKWALDHFDTFARERELVLFPGCAFEFALGDLAAELAWSQAASRIVIAYVVKEMTMSEGTKKSLLRSFSQEGVTFIDGQLEEKKIGYRLFDVPLPGGETQKGAWIPGGEALTVPRRGGVSRVETCIVAGEGLAYFVGTFSAVIPPMLRALRPLADRIVERRGADVLEPDPFLIIAFDPKRGQTLAMLRGEDIYGTTARIAMETALRISQNTHGKSGFVGAADLFEAREFLSAVGVEILTPGERKPNL